MAEAERDYGHTCMSSFHPDPSRMAEGEQQQISRLRSMIHCLRLRHLGGDRISG